MNEQKIKQAYDYAVERYAAIGVDVEKAMEQLQKVQLSLHCWQADDVTGFVSRLQETILERLATSTNSVPIFSRLLR